MLDCLVHKYIGIDCPTCGMQRAFYAFIRLDWKAAWEFNPAIFPLMILFGLISFSYIKPHISIFRKVETTLWIKRGFYFFCAVLILQYSIKLFLIE
jgi:hypothetical protein